MALADRLLDLARALDAPVRWLGGLLALLVLLLVLAGFAVVLLRYGWDWSQPWLRETVLALNAAIFLLGAAYALQRDEHVRVDVLSRHWSPRTRAWVELLGMLGVVLPFAIFIGVYSLDYVLHSWRIGESSSEPGGLPALWLQKSLILGMAITLGLQALARAARFGARIAAADDAEHSA
ncbi:MAG: TRAP transporter small permease subunit [Lysobacterales bacterium]|nr:TRAP transporter small permease subunit [Xanthomonadales bacterium]MCP5476713.1 TRAP transporter small permease subunit [Rhodanobacteraceae bacterium]